MKALATIILTCYIIFGSLINANASSIKISTYNILASQHLYNPVNFPGSRSWEPWGSRKNEVFEVIDSANPDILALQEEDNVDNQVNDVNQHLRNSYTEVAHLLQDQIRCGHTADKQERVSIWVKTGKFVRMDSGGIYFDGIIHPAPGNNEEVFCHQGFTWAKLQQISTGNIFYIYNTHTNSQIHINPGDQAWEKTRRLEMVQIANHMWSNGDPDDYRILTGDLNAQNRGNGDDISLLYWINEKDLYLSTPMSYPVNFQKLYCADPETDCINGKVDHVLISEGLKQVDAFWSGDAPNANGFYPSDHDMLTVVLRPDYSWLVPLMEYLESDL